MKIRRFLCLLLVLIMVNNNFASIVSDLDGELFITRGVFNETKNQFARQIDEYNKSISEKTEGYIAEYLAGMVQTNQVNLTCASKAEENWFILSNNPNSWTDKIPKVNITLARMSKTPGLFEGNTATSYSSCGGCIAKYENDGVLARDLYCNEVLENGVKYAELQGIYTWQPQTYVFAVSTDGEDAAPTVDMSKFYPNSNIGADVEAKAIEFTIEDGVWTGAAKGLFFCKEQNSKLEKKIALYGVNQSLNVYSQVVGDRKYSSNAVSVSNWKLSAQYKYKNSYIGNTNLFSMSSWKETYSYTYKTLGNYRNAYVDSVSNKNPLPATALTVSNPGAGYHLTKVDRNGEISFKFMAEHSDIEWTMEASQVPFNWNTNQTTSVYSINNTTRIETDTKVTVKNGDRIKIQVEQGSVFLRIIPKNSTRKYEAFYNPEGLSIVYTL